MGLCISQRMTDVGKFYFFYNPLAHRKVNGQYYCFWFIGKKHMISWPKGLSRAEKKKRELEDGDH